MTHRRNRRIGCVIIAATVIAAPPVHAQTAEPADERTVERAADAFGIRIGVEQIGLYSETQARIQSSGFGQLPDQRKLFREVGGDHRFSAFRGRHARRP